MFTENISEINDENCQKLKTIYTNYIHNLTEAIDEAFKDDNELLALRLNDFRIELNDSLFEIVDSIENSDEYYKCKSANKYITVIDEYVKAIYHQLG